MRSHSQTSHPHSYIHNPSVLSFPTPVPDKKNSPSTEPPKASKIQAHNAKGSHHTRTNSVNITPSQHDPQPFGPLLGAQSASKQHRRQGSFNRYDPQPVTSSSFRFNKYNKEFLL